jgi:hypothetical protein
MKLEFSREFFFSKNTQISNLMKIRPVGADLLHADRLTDGWTDMTKLTVAFLNFAKAPTNALVKYKFCLRQFSRIYVYSLKICPYHIVCVIFELQNL